MNFKLIRNLALAIIFSGLIGINLYKNEILEYKKVSASKDDTRGVLSTCYDKANDLLLTLTLDEKIEYLLFEENNYEESFKNVKSSVRNGLLTEDEIDQLVLNVISWKIFNELMI